VRYESEARAARSRKSGASPQTRPSPGGLIAASVKSGARHFPGKLSDHAGERHPPRIGEAQEFPVKTFRREDEIAGISAAIGASYGGADRRHDDEGPGWRLKTEAMGLAVMLELPLIICDVQRGGPEYRITHEAEQADLLQRCTAGTAKRRSP